MNKLHLYLLTATLTLLGVGLALYKAHYLGFPLLPQAKTVVWNVEARIKFVATRHAVQVSLFLPSSSRNFAVLDEQFLSAGLGLVATRKGGNRVATWSARGAKGTHNLYYQAVVRKIQGDGPRPTSEQPDVRPHGLEGPKLEAAKVLVEELKHKSADTPTFVGALIKLLNQPEPDDSVKILIGRKPSLQDKVKTAVKVLSLAGIPARQVNGIRLKEGQYEFVKNIPVFQWLEVHHDKVWNSYHPVTAATPAPENWLRWWRGPEKLLRGDGAGTLSVTVSISPKIEEGIASAVRRTQISAPLLLRFSLFSLPVNTQAVYRIILLIPVGALLLVILRNVVGIKTFGTFMPVLIAISFRETGVWKGILLFVALVALGLAARFYLERLKLLVVPRLAAVLIVVVGIMALLSILSTGLGGRSGISVALFPLVIVTMTIERMSIVWEERGWYEAVISGIGSLVTAALSYVVMNIELIAHLVFVFPELLLVLLAATLLLGRYTGYRLTDLYRFRELSRG